MLVHDDGHLRACAAHRRQHFVERRGRRNVGNGTRVANGDWLLQHDVPLAEAVELASAAVGSPALAAGGKVLAERLTRGETIRDVPKGFPPLLAWMLASGLPQAQLCRSLARSAEVYREEVARRSQWLMLYVPLVLTIVISGGVVLIYALLTLGPWLAILRRLTQPHFSSFF